MACGAVSESSPKPWPHAAHVKRQSGLPVFLKNNTKPQSAWQEIVDFLNQPLGAQPGAFAAPREC